jgi:hypothetical protein
MNKHGGIVAGVIFGATLLTAVAGLMSCAARVSVSLVPSTAWLCQATGRAHKWMSRGAAVAAVMMWLLWGGDRRQALAGGCGWTPS